MTTSFVFPQFYPESIFPEANDVTAAKPSPDRINVERIGGLAGFGGSRLKSAGVIALSDLSPADRDALDAFFQGAPTAHTPKPDAFVYRITRNDGGASKTIEVSEEHVPAAIRGCVKTTLD